MSTVIGGVDCTISTPTHKLINLSYMINTVVYLNYPG